MDTDFVGIAEARKGEQGESRRQLEAKFTGSSSALLRGPFVQHNFLVRCGRCLSTLNPASDQCERFWRIFPAGGYYSRAGDACAFVAWLVFIIIPFIAVGVGCFCTNNINIVIAVVVSLAMTSQLVMSYVIFKNDKKFKRLWYVSKVNVEQYLGWQNQVKDVNLENVNNLDLLSAGIRKNLIKKLAKHPDGVTVMIYTKSFWKCHVLYPVVSLITLSALDLVALIVQLEMMRRPDS
ncbi:uncharacterized protein LOC124290765 [Haliotis rubra]|uniref:uncharacterized protein LOC124290765 n=1 Tax=Haliotis rubra TaxID=36100 RepID=UPI001EE55656|nr:uncharacterized protein LOC124290765 [Haliotis rubra]